MKMVISPPRLKRALVWTSVFLLAVTYAVGAVPPREPSQREGTWAVGGDLGLQNTTGDDDFETEPILGGYAEYFATDHFSMRGMVQFVDMDHDLPGPGPGSEDAEIVILGGNALYNWDGRQVSPFVTGGLAIYDYDTESGRADDTEAGMNVGGGMNLLVTRAVGVKFEGLVHVTAQDEGPDSFVVGTGGIRFIW